MLKPLRQIRLPFLEKSTGFMNYGISEFLKCIIFLTCLIPMMIFVQSLAKQRKKAGNFQ